MSLYSNTPLKSQIIYNQASASSVSKTTPTVGSSDNYHYYKNPNNNNKDYNDNDDNNNNKSNKFINIPQHIYVLPVLLFEFLALALTRAVMPSLLIKHFHEHVYIIMGIVDCIRGLLAFIACPIFGKISDIIGRRICLFITVLGTCIPVCSLAIIPYNKEYIKTIIQQIDDNDDNNFSSSDTSSDHSSFWSSLFSTAGSSSNSGNSELQHDSEQDIIIQNNEELMSSHTNSINSEQEEQDFVYIIKETLPYEGIIMFIILLSLSGIFSSTFTLVFAYISDSIKQRDERASAYGLALATFGLSFTIGPMVGGYMTSSSKYHSSNMSSSSSSPRNVFMCSLILTILDLLYIYFILPESNPKAIQRNNNNNDNDDNDSDSDENEDTSTIISQMTTQSIRSQTQQIIKETNTVIVKSGGWSSPIKTIKLIYNDPFLKKISKVAFLYYTSLWAVISTLILYAAQRPFNFTPEQLGELMSLLGLCTMIAEAFLIRIFIPIFGEIKTMQLGLLSFTIQCIVLSIAYKSEHLFICIIFSLLGNLVYPSLSSIVSSNVTPTMIGEALGSINGIKSLTEGIGPLLFGILMTISQKYHPNLPGWPYIIAALLSFLAYKVSYELPNDNNNNSNNKNNRVDDEYIHELEIAKMYKNNKNKNDNDNDYDDEYVGLLSEIDDIDDDNDSYVGSENNNNNSNNNRDKDNKEEEGEDMSKLPLTFASFMSHKQKYNTTKKKKKIKKTITTTTAATKTTTIKQLFPKSIRRTSV